MKDQAIKIHIEQIAGAIKGELESEHNEDRICRLIDADEFLHRAWAAIDSAPRNANDTEAERQHNATIRKQFMDICAACEQYQNADIEGMDDDRVRADADRRVAEILGIARLGLSYT